MILRGQKNLMPNKSFYSTSWEMCKGLWQPKSYSTALNNQTTVKYSVF